MGPYHVIRYHPVTNKQIRYEISNGAAGWEEAEKQIRQGGASTVSIKSNKPPKRKPGETAREIYEKEIESKIRKKIKKGTEGRRK